jgi:FkbM family methyltransferase
MTFLRSFARSSLHSLGFELSRWPKSSERFEAQVLSCLHALPVRGIIDVGARNGSFSSSICCEHLIEHVLLVDPDLSGINYGFFARHVDRVEFVQAAAFSRKDSMTLYSYASPDFTSLLLPSPFGAKQFPESLQVVDKASISVDTLDALVFSRLLTHIRYLLKIDCQGVDLQVLLGSPRIMDVVDIICLEVSFQPIYEGQVKYDELFAFMESKSYSLASLTPVTRDSQHALIEANAIFVKNNQSA